MHRSPRRLSPFVSIAVAALALGAACTKTPQVAFSVSLPDAVASNTKWVEVGIFEGATCPETKQLLGGLPPTGYVTRLAFKRTDAAPPGLGDLKKGSYAFAAVARADDCSVVGVGCTVADLTTVRDVSIRVNANANAATACGTGMTCDYARCIPAHDNGTLGAACSLQLVGAGPLGDPLVPGTVVSAPAAVATDTGFLVGYREYDASLGAARLTLTPIDNGGGAGTPSQTTLPGRCAAGDESDATALAFSGSEGLAAVARAPCNGMGGVDLFQIDATGAVAKSSFNGGTGIALTLANARALAPLSNGSYLLAYTEAGETHVATVTNLALQAMAAPGFGGTAPQSAGWVATGDKVTALVAIGTGDTGVPSDGGAGDGGGDAGNDGGTMPGGETLRLNVVAAGANLGTLPAPFEAAASFASVAALGTRVIVVSDSSAPGRPLAWRAFDLGKTQPVANDSLDVPGLGKVLFADVALRQDHAFFAIEQPGAITLAAYDHATTTPTLLRTVFLPSDPRIPSMAKVRDGRVAIAASDSRVIVVWTTGRTLGENDIVGGYALFACTTP